MKFPLSCFVFSVATAISLSTTVSAQEANNDQKIAQMQSVINNLQSELESMKAQSSVPMAPTPAAIPLNEPTLAPYPSADLSSPYPPTNPSAPQYSSSYSGNYQPAYPQYAVPPVEPVFIQPPPVVVVEPAYCPHAGHYNSGFGGYGGGYVGGYGGGYVGGYGGGGLYVGPNGWGLGVGGLQLDFYGNGHGHGNSHGHGHGNGGGHKGNKGHKKH